MRRIRFTPPLVDQINITPMLDTAMTLLLIFVIISPIIGRGIAVKLPTAKGEKMPVTTTVVLTVDNKGAIFLGNKPVNPVFLGTDLQNLKISNPDLRVIIQADRSVCYERVVYVLDIVRQSGISAVGLATTPPPQKQKK
ncbi:MAG: biopolymer transporter ExbD [Candidatus Omnitrophota bacterium]